MVTFNNIRLQRSSYSACSSLAQVFKPDLEKSLPSRAFLLRRPSHAYRGRDSYSVNVLRRFRDCAVSLSLNGSQDGSGAGFGKAGFQSREVGLHNVSGIRRQSRASIALRFRLKEQHKRENTNTIGKRSFETKARCIDACFHA
jgi:hypothetical protein